MQSTKVGRSTFDSRQLKGRQDFIRLLQAIQDNYAESLKSGRKDGKGGLSARTVLHHYRVLRTALRQAVKRQLLSRNPADAVEPPRPRLSHAEVPSNSEVACLLDTSVGTRLHLPIVLAIGTGLRRDEILVVRWSDLGLVGRSLTVAQSLTETPDGLEFKEPKFSKGHGMIALSNFVGAVLEKTLVQQQARRELLSAAYVDSDLVGRREDGTPWPPFAFTSAHRDLLRRRTTREA